MKERSREERFEWAPLGDVTEKVLNSMLSLGIYTFLRFKGPSYREAFAGELLQLAELRGGDLGPFYRMTLACLPRDLQAPVNERIANLVGGGHQGGQNG